MAVDYEIIEFKNNQAPAINDTNLNKIQTTAKNAVTKLDETKQDKLTAGLNITIDENNVISATGGSSSGEITGVADVKVNGTSVVSSNIALITMSDVAISGNYNDLSNQPTGLATETYVDTAVSELKNDVNSNASDITILAGNVNSNTSNISLLNTKVQELENSNNNSVNNYSTEETVIGTWIDGKPLYRKVIEYTHTQAHSTEQTFDICTIPTTDVIRDIKGYLNVWESDRSSCQNWMFNSDNGARTTYYSVYLSADNSVRIKAKNNSSTRTILETVTIVEYTKTTD